MPNARTGELSKLDDGPTKHIQKRAEEHAKHGFHLNLNESPAYEDYNRRIINTLEKMLADGLKLNTRRQVCNTLRQLNRHDGLMKTEVVKTTICPPTINKNTHKLKTNITMFAHNRTPN